MNQKLATPGTYRKLSIGSLKLPGDMTKRMASAHVIRRAESISRHGLIHAPIVRRENWEVVAGCDRIAACMLLGWDSVVCDIRELTDSETAILRHAENAERRHDAEEQRRETAALKDAVERKLVESGFTENGSGRRTTASAEARREVSAATGIKEETLRKREQRQRKRDSERPAETPQTKEKQCVNVFELEVSEQFLAQVSAVQNYIKDAAHAMSRAQSALTQLEVAGLPVHTGRLQALRAAVIALSAEVRSNIPVSLCPYCKGTDGLQDKCLLCHGSGWIPKALEAGVPLKFWNTDVPLVLVDGEEHELSEFTFRVLGVNPATPEEDLFA